MVTIRMIAQACGVSPATVSKALNGAADINADTAKRIRRAAKEMGYIPNSAAIALKTSRSYNFGVVYDDGMHHGLTHEFFARIINCFKSRAEELGYDMTFISEQLGGHHIGFSEHAQRRNCDGVVIITTQQAIPEDVSHLLDSQIPVVSIDARYPGCSAIVSDNEGNMRLLTEYILSKGHRKVAFVHGDMTEITQIRLRVFRECLATAGIDLPEPYLREARYHDPKSTAEAVKALLALPDPPTCILCPDDFAYIGGLNVTEREGLSIPTDLSFAGFDGIAMSQAMRPRLTTLSQDVDVIGSRAAEELARAVEEGRCYKPHEVLVPGRLIHGETVRTITT